MLADEDDGTDGGTTVADGGTTVGWEVKMVVMGPDDEAIVDKVGDELDLYGSKIDNASVDTGLTFSSVPVVTASCSACLITINQNVTLK